MVDHLILNITLEASTTIVFTHPVYCIEDVSFLDVYRGKLALTASIFNLSCMPRLAARYSYELFSHSYDRICLSSSDYTRLANREHMVADLTAKGWNILDPLRINTELLLAIINRASHLITENGSILFNCFIARSKNYTVWASKRSICKGSTSLHLGGSIYNQFHSDLIQYEFLNVVRESKKHPFSDILEYTDYSRSPD